jgi:hypothetical protein
LLDLRKLLEKSKEELILNSTQKSVEPIKIVSEDNRLGIKFLN